jgi:7,8-dihydropterin-6-yl-methyl-4-(beta-D-ribofuranosyl)aminobenzene 5'-phosphate synthase
MKRQTSKRTPTRAKLETMAERVSGKMPKSNTSQHLISLPEVEKLTVTVITDNYSDAIRPDMSIGKRYRGGPGASIHAEHGLSFYIETLLKRKTHALMFDYGPDADVAIKNMWLLGIDAGKVNTFGLSHGHFDHWGGLLGILKHHSTKITKGIPLYVGGETFAHRYSVNLSTSVQTDIGQLKKKEIESLNVVEIKEIKEPTEAIPGCWLTGDIERITEYEKGASTLFVKRGRKLERDYLAGEQALVCNVKGKGLVVISGCAHAGIVNTVKHAQKITGIQKVHAIVGGFHLVNSEPEIIGKTIADIQAMKPDHIVPTHCTGFEAMAAFAREMPDQFILNTAGAQYFFTS